MVRVPHFMVNGEGAPLHGEWWGCPTSWWMVRVPHYMVNGEGAPLDGERWGCPTKWWMVRTEGAPLHGEWWGCPTSWWMVRVPHTESCVYHSLSLICCMKTCLLLWLSYPAGRPVSLCDSAFLLADSCADCGKALSGEFRLNDVKL